MRIAITGGTGFVGRHLARALSERGHETVLVARGQDRRDPAALDIPGARFVTADLSDPTLLASAFAGCQAIAHCAGINREIGRQTYQRVHVDGTRAVIEAAGLAGVGTAILLSFLRARPGCGSPYHESKWAAEEIVRGSNLLYTIVKAGVIYGRGDHLLDHLSRALYTFPVFALVGFRNEPMRPLAVEDLVRILVAALTGGRLVRRTVAVVGPEQLTLREVVGRVARVVHRHPLIVPAPIAFHRLLAAIAEATMRVPMASAAQVRILSESLVEPWPPYVDPPSDLTPTTAFTDEQIRRGLPAPGRFGLADLRWGASAGRMHGS